MNVVLKNYDTGSVSLAKGFKIGPSRAQIVDNDTWLKLKQNGRVQALLKAGKNRGLEAVTPDAFIRERQKATGNLKFLLDSPASDQLLYIKGVEDKALLAEIGKVVKHQAAINYIKNKLAPKKTTKTTKGYKTKK